VKKLTFFLSETCSRCNDPFKYQLTKLYLEFLTTQVIPKLTKKTIEYAEWWIFKPESPLVNLIEKNQLSLNLYFRPIELTSLIEDIANKNNLFGRGNYNVMQLNEELKQCFNTTSVYLPDLYSLCLSHVNVVNDSKSFLLKNELIKNELYVDSPLDIIYSDPSSKFWIPREIIHPYVCDDNQIIFTWKELCSKFTKIITSPESNITQMGNSLFFVNSNSCFAQLLNFKQFHKNQIPDILKKTTKFLGKSNSLLTLCSDLKFTHIRANDPVVYWIEELILKNNNVTPYIPSGIYL